MGNTWKGISDQDLHTAELQLLKRAGLSSEDYIIHDTPIDEADPEKYIHSVEVICTSK
jgi:hypothetical protein